MALLSLLLAACAVYPQKGFYEGATRSAWKHSIELASGGVNAFEPPAELPFHFQVTFSTSEKGKIYMAIYYPLQSPIFLRQHVIVEFDNGEKESFEAQQGMNIDVSASDSFTITVPPFRLNGIEFPELVAEFKWNESTKYYIRGIQ